jgi:hypothetical protein
MTFLARLLSFLAIFSAGLSVGGCLTGIQAVGVPTPDFSPDARRLEDKITGISGSIFLVGTTLSITALASRFLVGRIHTR